MLKLQSPFEPPTLRDDLPRYPLAPQLLRVTSATVPGPSGYRSSSVLGPVLYVASTQQLRTDTILPRDREPCLADDVAGFGLTPGYYLGRLAGSHTSLPVYEVIGGPTALGLFGLTFDQQNSIINNLYPAQIAALNNLNACQLQTLLTSLNVSQVWELTTNLTATQLTTLVGTLTTAQLTSLVTTLTKSQILTLTNNLAPYQISQLLQVFTTAQLKFLLTNLSVTELQNLLKYPPAEMLQLFTNNSITQLETFLDQATPPNTPITNKLTADFTTSSSTFVDVTGLSIPVAANTDTVFEFTFATTNTGTPSAALNGPTSPTFLAFVSNPSPTTQVTAYDTGVTLTTSATRVITKFSGIFRNGPNAGTLILRVKTATGTVTVYQGSGVMYY